MKHLFPNLPAGAPTNQDKVSRQNMDNVYNSVIALVNCSDHAHKAQLISILSTVYNRIQIMYHEGALDCLKSLKLLRKWYVEFARGVRELNPGLRAWHWDVHNRHPILLAELIDFVGDGKTYTSKDLLLIHRTTIALLSLDRVMLIPVEPSYDSIKLAGKQLDKKHEFYPKDFHLLAPRIGIEAGEFKKMYTRFCEDFEYEVLNSAGVNGKATWTAHSDAKAFMLNPSVFSALKDVAVESGMKSLVKDLLGTVPVSDLDTKDVKQLRLGRLHSFDEWGGKCRTVAIVDYWTQMALTPLHNTINYFLKRMMNDGTFDQSRVADIVKLWTRDENNVINSYDLSTATDRLPASLQVDILAWLLDNRKLAEAWRSLLTDREFFNDQGQAYKYAVGQPMGARSSFPMLALTHHICIQHALRLSDSKSFGDYVVLGDDMSLKGNKESLNYREVMEYLGVPINLSKSVLAGEDKKPAAEICKRIFIAGEEITSIPVKLIAKTVKDGTLAPILQNEFAYKSNPLTGDTFTYFFYSLLNEASFKDLVVLNTLPKDCNGLVSPVRDVSDTYSDASKWYEGFSEFNFDVISKVFTYTGAVECLKRLDALLRQTLAIGTAISQKYDLYTNSRVDVVQLWDILGIPTDVPSDVVSSLVKDLHEIEASHPIVKASEAEIKRVTEIMAGLLNHDVTIAAKARAGLLDMVRNALADIWVDTEAAKASGIRTLTNKGLQNLNLMVNKGLPRKTDAGMTELDKTQMSLEYNLTLNTLGRQWTVRVSNDDPVTINAVKSKVIVNPKAFDDKIKKLIKGIKITPSPKVSS